MKKNSLIRNTLTIVDVGASGGIHSRWSNSKLDVRPILFEPDSQAFEKLSLIKNDNSLLINAALSDTAKQVEFNVCEWQEVSSIYKPNFNLISKYHDPDRFAVKTTLLIQADSLNNLLCKEEIKEIDFMKIDTQGSELDILKGSSNYLDGLIGLEVEVEFVEIYEKQPLFPEVNDFIESYGFSLIDMKKTFWKRSIKDSGSRKGQLIFADALYLKEPEQVFKINDLDKEKIIRSIYIYLAYGYLDLASELLRLAYEKNFISKDLNLEMDFLINSYNKEYILPNFKGKGKIKNLFYYIANIFNTISFSSGSDEKLGN